MTRTQRLAVLLAAVLTGATDTRAQLTEAPTPIPPLSIPSVPRLAPPPAIHPTPQTPPARPATDLPGPPHLAPVTIPPPAEMTPAAKDEPAAPAALNASAGPLPLASPGARASGVISVTFAVLPRSSQIPGTALPKLKEVAETLKSDPAARVEVRTFSPISGKLESDARRLSLARFVSVRDYLVQNGVADSRIDARALSSASNEPNADRVELFIER